MTIEELIRHLKMNRQAPLRTNTGGSLNVPTKPDLFLIGEKAGAATRWWGLENLSSTLDLAGDFLESEEMPRVAMPQSGTTLPFTVYEHKNLKAWYDRDGRLRITHVSSAVTGDALTMLTKALDLPLSIPYEAVAQ